MDGARLTHNPEVAGSNPAPATRSEAPSDQGRGLLHVICKRAAGHAAVSSSPAASALPVLVISTEASDPPMISSASVFATWRSACPGRRGSG
jgi:hypothetical protein